MTATATTTAKTAATPAAMSAIVPSSAPGIRAKTLSPRQIDEVMFWVPQLKELCLALQLGLQPVPMIVLSPLLPAADSTIADSKASQMPSVENNKLVAKLKYRCKLLVSSWSGYELQIANSRMIDVPILSNLVNHTRYVLSRLIDLLEQQVWVGWLFPSFIQLLRNKLDYFVRRFNDSISADPERLFWTETNAIHLATLARWLDPLVHRSMIDQLVKLSNEGMNALAPLKSDNPRTLDVLQMAALSRQFDHLSYANRTASLLSELVRLTPNLYPVIFAHIARDTQRSVNRLTLLK